MKIKDEEKKEFFDEIGVEVNKWEKFGLTRHYVKKDDWGRETSFFVTTDELKITSKWGEEYCGYRFNASSPYVAIDLKKVIDVLVAVEIAEAEKETFQPEVAIGVKTEAEIASQPGAVKLEKDEKILVVQLSKNFQVWDKVEGGWKFFREHAL